MLTICFEVDVLLGSRRVSYKHKIFLRLVIQSKRFCITSLASAPISDAFSGAAINFAMAFAKAIGSLGGTIRPVL